MMPEVLTSGGIPINTSGIKLEEFQSWQVLPESIQLVAVLSLAALTCESSWEAMKPLCCAYGGRNEEKPSRKTSQITSSCNSGVSPRISTEIGMNGIPAAKFATCSATL